MTGTNDWHECPHCLGTEGHTDGDDWIPCPHCQGQGGWTTDPTTTYMLFDAETANAIDSYDNPADTHAALRQAAQANPDTAGDLVLIGYSTTGLPVGKATTYADLPHYICPRGHRHYATSAYCTICGAGPVLPG